MIARFVLFVFTFTLLLFYSFTITQASLLKVSSNGQVVWKVLSSEDQTALIPRKSELTVRDVAGTGSDQNSILLKKEDERVILNVGSDKKLDVTNWNEEVVEIEERENVRKFKISVKDKKFIIHQANIFAHTQYPIQINPRENNLSLVTSSGAIYVTILPVEAVETALKTRLVNRVEENVDIIEKDLGSLSYVVKGEKVVNLFNLIKLNIPVTTNVSASTGEILSIEQPRWLPILNFLFS